MKVNPLALNAQTYLTSQVSPFFTSLPSSGALECKHLPAAVLGEKNVEVITDLIRSCKRFLTKSHKKGMRLTLHHLAAIANRTDLLPVLCDKKIKMPQDTQGFTPLHFRALLTDQTTYKSDPYRIAFKDKCKLKKGPNYGSRNEVDQTPEELHKLIVGKERRVERAPQAAQGLPSTLSIFTDVASMHPISDSVQVEERCLGDFTYVTENVASRNTLIDTWRHLPKNNQLTLSTLGKAYEKYLASPPKLRITSTGGASGCGVFTAQDIPAKSIISSFDGEIILDRQITTPEGAQKYTHNISDYYFGMAETDTHRQGIEPVDFRSAASMLNDGPPNVAHAYLYNKDGLAEKLVLYANRDIKAGEELTICYGGMQTTKFLDYQLTDPQYQSVVDVLSKSPFKNVFKLFGELQTLSRNPVDGQYDPSMYGVSPEKNYALQTQLYILNTPQILNRLTADGHITTADIRSLLKKANLPYYTQVPMVFSNLQNTFLLAAFRERCAEHDAMGFFNEIMIIITQNFARFQKAHLDMDLLGRQLNVDTIKKSLGKLLDASWPKTSSGLEKLKELFHKGYALSDLNEGQSQSQKRQLSKRIEDKGNDQSIAFLLKYNIWSPREIYA